jgi:hypothetical protein
MLLGVTWFVMYAVRFLDFHDFYGNDGWLPVDMAMTVMPRTYDSPWPFYFHSDVLSYWAYWLFLGLLLLLALGLIGRAFTWIAFFLHVGFVQRNIAVAYGADQFTIFWLLYLSVVQHDRFFTLKPYLKNWFGVPVEAAVNRYGDMLSSVGIRLLQIQLCVCYAYTGIEKLKGTQWWEGTAVWYVLGMKELLPGDYTFLQNFPLLIGVMTMATVIFETYFPCAMLSRKVRPYWLAIGLMFHLGTAIFMSLPFFCMVMVSLYVLFLPQEWAQHVVKAVLSVRKARSSQP